MGAAGAQPLRLHAQRGGAGRHAPEADGDARCRAKKKLATEGHVALYLNFDTDKTTLRPEAQPVLAEVRTLLTQSPELRLAVQGHTDNTSTPAHNQQLSEGRARAVVAALTAQGIAARRLSPSGFGQTKPLADNATEAGRAQNRRVELVKL